MLRAVHPDWQILGAATNLKSNKPMAKKMRERLASLGYVEESKRFTKVPDPAFDSSGLTHILVTELIQLAIPNIKE